MTMVLERLEEPRISPRMRDALIADLAVEDHGDHWTRVRLPEPRDWTDHLARQLGLNSHYEGIHETLLIVVEQLDVLIRDWPPPTDHNVCLSIARQATKNLDALELYSTLLAGPGRWRKTKLPPESTYTQLPKHMQVDVERVLAGELARLLEQWKVWDIPRLRQKRKAATSSAEPDQQDEPNVARSARRRPNWRDRQDLPRDGYFIPPGRI